MSAPFLNVQSTLLLGMLVLGLALPKPALAQDLAQLLAEVLLVDPDTYEGGSLFGPPQSRGTWYSFGDIQPVDGSAMLAFSTGDADGPPQPGTDLGVLDGADDRAGMNLSLRVPEGARSMRLSYRFITPVEPEPDSAGDEARLLLQGELVALDPWTLSAAAQGSAGLRVEPALEGTWFASPAGLSTAWTELALPVSPGDQLLVTLEVEDDPASDLGDVLLLLDRLIFDAGIPELGTIRPGRVPLINSASPQRIRPDAAASLDLFGRDLPGSGAVQLELESSEGTVLPLANEDVTWISGERLRLSLPPLDESSWGVRLSWEGGVLLWPGLFEVAEQVPRLLSVQPDTGPAAGGGLALIEGLGFEEVSSLRWGGELVSSYAVLSPELIEVVIPPGAPGPVDVSVFAEGGFNEAPAFYRYAQAAGSQAPQAGDPEGTPPGSCNQSGKPSLPSGGLVLLVLLGILRQQKRRA
jgi:hypothetical protein